MARAAVSVDQTDRAADNEWIGIGFKLGDENFVAPRSDVREILPLPEQLTRVPGAKSWLKGIANIRGQLLTIVDLKAFLSVGHSMPSRHARILMAASREVPTGLIVDEVTGFRRFAEDDFDEDPGQTAIRCEPYLDGRFRRGAEIWPRFSIAKLLRDERFLNAGEQPKGQAAHG